MNANTRNPRAAELRARAASHLRRAMEIEQAMQEMGVRT